jgi:hypothetical protein
VTLADCQREISAMVERSKTRLIAPTLILGLMQSCLRNYIIVFNSQ